MEGMKVNVVEEKVKIVSYIKTNGPVVAHAVGKSLGLNSFLASALLSELLREKVITQSTLKMGGSSLYYVSGQEPKLSNFTNFLGFKEREAFFLLKEKAVMEDKKCDPAIRVAFRAIKDFAVPLVVSKDGVEKLFWKFYLASNDEASAKIKEMLESEAVVSAPTPAVAAPAVLAPSPILAPVEEKKEEIAPVVEMKKAVEEIKVQREPEEVPKKKTVKKKSSSFHADIQEWLGSNGVKMRNEIFSDNKSFKAVVAVSSGIGELDFLLISKDKKAINEGEVALAYQEGNEQKLPVIFLTGGKLSKKALEVVESFKGRLVMRKL